MAKIIASGAPVTPYIDWEIYAVISGTDVEIHDVSFKRKMDDGTWEEDPLTNKIFESDMERGPTYPLCADPGTMRRALFILYEWFGEDKSCWVEDSKHVQIIGEIEPMPSEPGVIY